jgi:DNA adenine methylase
MPQPLFKYIGNKYRSAERIVKTFPEGYGTYFEPFFGSGAVLGRLAPVRSVATDVCAPLIDLWKLVQSDPRSLLESYTRNWEAYQNDRQHAYDVAKERFNERQNPHDFLFISRACYGGVIRFRKDGYLSTPIGPHTIINPSSFAKRLSVWNVLTKNTRFETADFSDVVSEAGENDIVYCDPPYIDTQKILYGAQAFDVGRMYGALREAKKRGAFVALSIDGVKRSGDKIISVVPPSDLFEVETYLSLGGSMLKRFWREGGDVVDEHVKDRLLLSCDLSRQREVVLESQLGFAAIAR